MGAVRPENGVALKEAAPPVIAGHVDALTGAILRIGRRRGDQCGGGDRQRCRRGASRSQRYPSMPTRPQISRRRKPSPGSPAGAGAVFCRSAWFAKLLIFLKGLDKFRSCGAAPLAKIVTPLQERASGEMAEWLKAHAWKACVRETVPWVRIPLSPPYAINFSIFLDFIAPDWSAKYVRHFLWFSIFTA